jgi:hypothetical protein
VPKVASNQVETQVESGSHAGGSQHGAAIHVQHVRVHFDCRKPLRQFICGAPVGRGYLAILGTGARQNERARTN